MSFWEAYSFWREPMLAVLLAGALCGYLGVFILLRRVVFVSAALTQVSGVGIALAFWVASFVPGQDAHAADLAWWMSPQLYSVAAAILAAILFSRNIGRGRLASETVVALGWVLASAALLLILSSKRIVAEAHEVDDLLYGSAVLTTLAQVKTLGLVALVLFVVHLAFFKEFVFLTYDSEMASTLGYRTAIWDALLYATFGVGISFAVRAVGALPTFGFLVLPAASAQLLVKRVQWAFPLAVAFAMGGGALGYYIAFTREYPTGAALVAACGLFLLPGLIVRMIWR